MLQLRKKLFNSRRNLRVEEIVIVIEDNVPRNAWKIARVVDTYPDKDGLFRKFRLKVADSTLGKNGRPTDKS